MVINIGNLFYLMQVKIKIVWAGRGCNVWNKLSCGRNYITFDFSFLAPYHLVNLKPHYCSLSRHACPELDHTNFPDFGLQLLVCSAAILKSLSALLVSWHRNMSSKIWFPKIPYSPRTLFKYLLHIFKVKWDWQEILSFS